MVIAVFVLFVVDFHLLVINCEINNELLLNRLEKLEQKMYNIETENRQQQSEINRQKSTTDTQQSAIDMLQSHNDRQQLMIDRQQSMIERQHSMIDRLTNCKNASWIDKRLLEGSIEPTVAFSSYINHAIDHVTPNTVIPFEMVTTNEGNAFHGPTGLFTCPRSGLYLFVWNVAVDTGFSTQIKFIVNGKTRRWSLAGSSQHFTNGANHDIVRLQVGDRVWIADDYTNGQIHPHHTTFSGVMIST